VGVKTTIVLAGLAAFILFTIPAQAQRTRFQGITQCSRQASVQFGRQDSSFRRFVIERVSVQDEKFANLVGNQFVSTVYYGRAMYENAAGPKRMRFICLHAGMSKGAVFVYAMPE
jgi:hypothetical protein